MQSKTPKESSAILTEIVLPNDTNNLDNLMGGRLLYWMDIIAAITAQRHCNRTSVTASVNNVSFKVHKEVFQYPMLGSEMYQNEFPPK